MNDKTTQTGKDDAAAAAEPAPTEKPKTVTQLLDEWDEAAKPKAVTEPKAAEPVAKAEDRITAVERELAERAYQEELTNVVEKLTDGLDVDIPRWEVEGWVNKQADDDTRISDLFTNRDSRGQHWGEIVKALKPEFQVWAKTRAPTPQDKTLGAAVRAAKDVKVTTGKDDGSTFGDLSDSEFALKKAEVFRQVKAGKLS